MGYIRMGFMMQIANTSSFFDYLSSRYPLIITVRLLSEITNENEQSIRNSISKGDYPIPSFKLGHKRLFRLTNVASYIEHQVQISEIPKVSPKPLGRPTKAEQIAKRRLNANLVSG